LYPEYPVHPEVPGLSGVPLSAVCIDDAALFYTVCRHRWSASLAQVGDRSLGV